MLLLSVKATAGIFDIFVNSTNLSILIALSESEYVDCVLK